jgi:hypothetical protein
MDNQLSESEVAISASFKMGIKILAIFSSGDVNGENWNPSA